MCWRFRLLIAICKISGTEFHLNPFLLTIYPDGDTRNTLVSFHKANCAIKIKSSWRHTSEELKPCAPFMATPTTEYWLHPLKPPRCSKLLTATSGTSAPESCGFDDFPIAFVMISVHQSYFGASPWKTQGLPRCSRSESATLTSSVAHLTWNSPNVSREPLCHRVTRRFRIVNI